jgi:hypothetical protein
VRERDAYGASERAIFAAAANVHRTAQRDRAARLAAITRLRDVLSRYARRTRRRSRDAGVLLASLVETTTQTARRLEHTAQNATGRPTGPGVAPP